MTSWVNLFSDGKYSECSDKLSELLNSASNEQSDGAGSISEEHVFSLYFQHNKIICDALSHICPAGGSQQSTSPEPWCTTFIHLDNFCKMLCCEQVASHIPEELFLITTLNLLWWSWENACSGDGSLDRVEQWIIRSLQTELSRHGENALYVENVLDLAEACSLHLLTIPPKRSHIVLDIIMSYFLLSLRHGILGDELTRCLKILDNLLKSLPLIHIHLTSGNPSAERHFPPLFFLGPNAAGSDYDVNLSVNLVVITNVLFILTTQNYEKASQILRNNRCCASTNLQNFIEYLNAFICFQQSDLDKASYHLDQISAAPHESLMVKRQNTLSGRIHFLKNDFKTALEHFCGRSNLSDEEDQLPITVFFMARTYEALNLHTQQIAIWECLTDALRRDPGHLLSRSDSPSSVQTRLLGCLHKQPEVTLLQTLICSATALIKHSRAKDASELLLEALKIMKLNTERCQDPNDSLKVPSLPKVLRNAVTMLAMCGDKSKAHILCKALTDPQLEEKESSFNRAVARMLQAIVQTDLPAESRQEILLESIRLLSAQRVVSAKDKNIRPSLALIDLLLACGYYRKAKLCMHSGFDKDADFYFQRALASNPGDDAIVTDYRSHLEKNWRGDSIEPFVMRNDEAICSELNVSLGYLLQLKKQRD